MTALSLQAYETGYAIGRLIGVAIVVLLLAGGMKILNKAGYSAFWVIVLVVPFVNVAMFLAFAFGDWPVLKRLRHAEQSARQPYPPQGYPPYGYPGYPQPGYPPQGHPQGYPPQGPPQPGHYPQQPDG